MTTITMTTAHR